jgi:hypothetical protein
MTDVNDPVDPDRAFELERNVMAARNAERASWLPLAAALYAFHATQAWKELGWERFTDWLADPELGLGRRHAYRMIAVWSWAQDNQIDNQTLAECDITKLAVVLPAVLKDETLDIAHVLSDVQALSRSDLNVKYGGGTEGGTSPLKPPTHEPCQQCGRQVLIEASAGAEQ